VHAHSKQFPREGNYSGLVLKYASGGQLHAVTEWYPWRKKMAKCFTELHEMFA
jgi:hypothetical protein